MLAGKLGTLIRGLGRYTILLNVIGGRFIQPFFLLQTSI